MVFNIELATQKYLNDAYETAMKDLGEFFGLTWDTNRPEVFIVNDRKTIDQIKGYESQRWVVGFNSNHGNIFLLKKENFKTEADKEYSDEKYAALMKHELAHCFYEVLSANNRKPYWLAEGVALYVAGQLKFRKKVEKFENFLSFFDKVEAGIYHESGWVVLKLVEKYGKDRLLELIKATKTKPAQTEFAAIFEQIYGQKLSYDLFNS